MTHEEYQQYLGYVEKHGSREQVVAATLGAAGTYSKAHGQKIAKMEAAGAAGVVAGVPAAIAGYGAAAVGAVAGGAEGFVGGLLDGAAAGELFLRTAASAVAGATIGWVVNKVGAFIAGEPSPSTPGAGKSGTTPLKPVSGEPEPLAPTTDAPSGLNTGPFEVGPSDLAPAPAAPAPAAAPAAPTTVSGTSRTYITYELKNAQGEVVYVGRASGVGTPEEVLQQRLSKGHHVMEGNPGLTAEVKAVQGGAPANKGAEGVLYEQRLAEGAQLLNDPQTPPLSSKPAKAAAVREKVDAYHEDLKKP